MNANFKKKKKIKSKLYRIENSKWSANSVNLDEVAHYEPSLSSSTLFANSAILSLVLKELK